jgi:hypothetical protein
MCMRRNLRRTSRRQPLNHGAACATFEWAFDGLCPPGGVCVFQSQAQARQARFATTLNSYPAVPASLSSASSYGCTASGIAVIALTLEARQRSKPRQRILGLEGRTADGAMLERHAGPPASTRPGFELPTTARGVLPPSVKQFDAVTQKRRYS